MEKPPITELSPDEGQILFDSLDIDGRLLIDGSYSIECFGIIGFDEGRVQAWRASARKSQSGGPLREWRYDEDIVELRGSCERVDRSGGTSDLAGAEQGVVQVGRMIWLEANRKGQEEPVRFVIGPVNAIQYIPGESIVWETQT